MSLKASEKGIKKEYLTKNGKIKASAIVGGGGGGGGVTSAQANTLNVLLKQVAYISPNIGTAYNAFLEAWGVTHVSSITAVYNQTTELFDTTPLDNLKADLTVTAYYSDGSTSVVTNYTLTGTLTEGTSTITVSYEGKTTTFNVTVSAGGGIPDDYQQVEWIKNSNPSSPAGVNAYIDTELILSDKSNFEIKVLGSDIGIGKAPFGVRNIAEMNSTSGKWFFRRGTERIDTTVTTTSGPHVMKMIDRVCSINGETVGTFSDSTTQFESTHSALMFAMWDSNLNPPAPNFNTSQTIYYCKVWEDETLVADFVPVYRKSDGVIGMYDLSRRKFYTNAGSPEFEFTKGADVN